MKKILNFVLASAVLVTAIPAAYATETQNHYATQITYESANQEAYTVTVPATLTPGSSGIVTLEGQYPSNKTIRVTADTNVTLTNEFSDTKKLNVTFDGIYLTGNNTSQVQDTATVSVAAIENAIFGTWTGRFNYQVDIAAVTDNVCPVVFNQPYQAQIEGDGVSIPYEIIFYEDGSMSLWIADAVGEYIKNVTYNENEILLDNSTSPLIILDNHTIYDSAEDMTFTLSPVTSGTISKSEPYIFDHYNANNSGHPTIVFNEDGSINFSDGTTTDTIPASDFYIADSFVYNLEHSLVGIIYPDGSKIIFDEGIFVRNSTIQPSTLTTINRQDGETYSYGDYTYTYSTEDKGWAVSLNLNVTDKNQTIYGPIQEVIMGVPVTSLEKTFIECEELTTAPAIPKNVTNMEQTFNCCYSLTTAPEIPESVTNMYGTFYFCVNLTTAPVIPNSITNMQGTFFACASLKTYHGSTDPDGDFSNYKIPSSVTNMNITFASCTSLTTAPVIPDSVTGMTQTFENCTSLTTAPIIPDSVTNMNWTFDGCTSLTTAPVIPSNVTNMRSTFSGCTSLTTAPVIPSGVTTMEWTFKGCTSLTTAPVIPSNVTNMQETFFGCTSLTGNIEINANPTEYDQCFGGTSQAITLTGTSTLLNELAATSNIGNITIG